MAEVFERARLLTKALRESPEWERMRRAAGPVRSSRDGERLLAQFRLQQLQYQAAQLQGAVTPEQTAAFQQAVQAVQATPPVRQYLEAELAYSRLLDEVQKVLAEVFDPEVPGALQGR